MRRLTYGLNVSLDGYVSAAGDDLSWSEPSDELFEWWLHEEQAVSLLLYGRRLWEDMSAYWPTRDQQPGTTPAQAAYAQNWRDTPKVVFSSSLAGPGEAVLLTPSAGTLAWSPATRSRRSPGSRPGTAG